MTKMRREYLAKLTTLRSCSAAMDGYSSKYPGVVEEAYEIMKAEKPLFLIGAFGGKRQPSSMPYRAESGIVTKKGNTNFGKRMRPPPVSELQGPG